jgi:hypothetical protein
MPYEKEQNQLIEGFYLKMKMGYHPRGGTLPLQDNSGTGLSVYYV